MRCIRHTFPISFIHYLRIELISAPQNRNKKHYAESITSNSSESREKSAYILYKIRKQISQFKSIHLWSIIYT